MCTELHHFSYYFLKCVLINGSYYYKYHAYIIMNVYWLGGATHSSKSSLYSPISSPRYSAYRAHPCNVTGNVLHTVQQGDWGM